MGQVVGMIMNEEERNLLNRLMDAKYKALYNNFIKNEIDRLAMVINFIVMDKDTDKECKQANELLMKIYEENRLDYNLMDNWFCYHLGDKLNKEAGIPLQHSELYEQNRVDSN